MKPEIKQRITQLNNGEVPDGYKKTEFGVFPCDWTCKKLSTLYDFKNGVNADKDKYSCGVKMISVMDILSDYPIQYDKIIGQVDIDGKTLNEYDVNYGDILFQRSSETFEDAGKSNVYLDSKVATYSGFVIRGKKKSDNNPFYINEALKCNYARKQITRSAAGSQHINIGQESLEKIIVLLPSIAEQEKIAKVLMKWDEAIELQEKYIEKLKEKKKVLISKLLTPKADWKQTKLGKIAEMYAGGTPSTQIPEYWNGNIPWIQSGLIQNNRISISDIDKTITEKGLDNSSATWIKANSVLVAITGATCSNIAYLDCNATANQSVISISTDLVNTLFIYYYLQNAKNQLLSLQNGSAQGGLTLKYLKNFSISYPKENKAQQQIADLLKFVDDNITFETKKCEKFKKQRKALQQYLLNGIVRV